LPEQCASEFDRNVSFKEKVMRIWGYVLMVLGILFLILFGFAELGGAHLGAFPFLIPIFLIAIGSGLRSSGMGILKSKPGEPAGNASVEVATAPDQASMPAAEFSTVELPLTPEITTLIARQTSRANRFLLYVSGGSLVFFIILGAVLAATADNSREADTFLIALGAVGVASAILIYGISWLTNQKPVRRDLHGTTYLRTTGPIEVVPISSGAMLRLADRAFMMNGRAGMKELSKLSRGTVDYTPHGHVILAAWDAEGRSVYCLPGYNA
jgi:hypothetical protein